MASFILANLSDIPYPATNQTWYGPGGLAIIVPGFYFIKQTVPQATMVTLAAGVLGLTIVKDASGNANTYPITVVVTGSTIDGDAQFVIAQPYRAAGFYWNGSEYSVVATV